MPIQHAIWQVGAEPKLLNLTTLASEQQLEDMIVREPRILSPQWMLIGRQEITGFGGRIDLLAIAPDASLVLIELKRDKTPREIVAQALDYASWVETLTAERIAQIYQRFSSGGNLSADFRQRFGFDLPEESLNQAHQIVLVAACLDEASERIIGYLNARDIPINVLFFQVFELNGEKLLSRAWLIDPGETQINMRPQAAGEKEPWNGEFYVSFGGDCSWEEARKYGFVSAGGGTWYSQTLKLLSPGDRVWVKIPKTGYVGVGRVREAVQNVHEFTVPTPSGDKPCLEVLSAHSESLKARSLDPETAEHFVRVEWLDTLPETQAFNEIGLFGNQNTVCQPTAPKWRHTVERLKQQFSNWDK